MSLEVMRRRSDEERAEVIVIGAGPVGLVSAIQLGRAGIKTLVLERRRTFSVHPKASGIHARTMEIYRQLDLSALIRRNSVNYRGAFSVGWMTRLNGIELGSITVGATKEELDRFESWSPEMLAFCSQDVYEPLFAEALKQYPSVELRMACEANRIEQDSESVSVRYAFEGGERIARGHYLIAADGVRSPTRELLGIAETGMTPFGDSINVVFNSDLELYRAGREYGLFWIVNAETQGAFGWRRRGNLWSYNFEASADEDLASYGPDRCAEIIRTAVGVPNVEIQIISILHWKHDQSVTDRWRARRVFLAGDAAHRFPPHGGFGMNSGVQDSHNLIWKLVGRLRWGAGDQLLDSYEQERKPVAQRNGAQCVLNTQRMAAMGWMQKGSAALTAIETPEGAELRKKIGSAIPAQREQFFSQGQQFGQLYSSTALIDDGTPIEESSVSLYKPTGRPGARAPHIWLEGTNGRRSTMDLSGCGFALLAARDGQPWLAAATGAVDATHVPLAAFRIGSLECLQLPMDPRWEDMVGVGSTGALLVRPDGYVGARWKDLPENPQSALNTTLNKILSLQKDRSASLRDEI
jgi:putative polyketide hydroxylase